jgi:DNA-binding HxlR family transcriptional regulator
MIEGLNKHFESRVRLGVMALLNIHDQVDFNTLKEELDLTDGNLASHLTALEKNEYISVLKEFVGRKPRTRYSCTKLGKTEFEKHLNALEFLLKQSK